jgi:hypothetical protein
MVWEKQNSGVKLQEGRNQMVSFPVPYRRDSLRSEAGPWQIAAENG